MDESRARIGFCMYGKKDCGVFVVTTLEPKGCCNHRNNCNITNVASRLTRLSSVVGSFETIRGRWTSLPARTSHRGGPSSLSLTSLSPAESSHQLRRGCHTDDIFRVFEGQSTIIAPHFECKLPVLERRTPQTQTRCRKNEAESNTCERCEIRARLPFDLSTPAHPLRASHTPWSHLPLVRMLTFSRNRPQMCICPHPRQAMALRCHHHHSTDTSSLTMTLQPWQAFNPAQPPTRRYGLVELERQTSSEDDRVASSQEVSY